MELLDPATGQPLPADAIQRVLFLAGSVHVYNIPPLTSTKGYTASTWTADGAKRQIFTARARVIETATESDGAESIKVDIVLEDPATGALFAAAPYESAAVVEPVLDSSRFFALRVRDPEGRKAMLGIGFEERSEAFDFGVSLQEAQKSLGFDTGAGSGLSGGLSGDGKSAKAEEKRDYSLKEGETITVSLPGSKYGRRARPQEPSSNASLSSFSLPPPPSASTSRANANTGSSFSLPPPPSASGSRGNAFIAPPPAAHGAGKQPGEQKKSAQDLGFDDGQFGEFA
jgi:adaptin ear-binding coat-associated protein 1/2